MGNGGARFWLSPFRLIFLPVGLTADTDWSTCVRSGQTPISAEPIAVVGLLVRRSTPSWCSQHLGTLLRWPCCRRLRAKPSDLAPPFRLRRSRPACFRANTKPIGTAELYCLGPFEEMEAGSGRHRDLTGGSPPVEPQFDPELRPRFFRSLFAGESPFVRGLLHSLPMFRRPVWRMQRRYGRRFQYCG